ncbi:hypothetical protein EV426DRAFT_603064 [Tirmania nivea]|nr:hypothetical protein EV426DRAFT_603064 [Tirmania nivea]
MVVRNRLHVQDIVQKTPERSVVGGILTPTLDGHATPACTVYTDDNASDSNSVVLRDTDDQFSAETSGIGIDERIVGSLTKYTGDGHGHGKAEQSSASQSRPILGYKSLQEMHRYIRLEMLLLFILSTATMTLWISWFGQGNAILLKGHRGNDVIPSHTSSSITTITKTVQVPTVETRYHTLTSTHVSTKTTTSVDIRTHTITTTRISTTTVSTVNTGNTPKPTGKAGSSSEDTLTRWGRDSSPIVQCYHGNAPTRYNFLSCRKKLWRQEALWGCLDNNKNGMRWTGVKCGGARWYVEVDLNSGVYSDSKKCWQRCEKCLSGAIKKALNEAECVVEDRGSRCVARYTEL